MKEMFYSFDSVLWFTSVMVKTCVKVLITPNEDNVYPRDNLPKSKNMKIICGLTLKEKNNAQINI